MRVSRNRAFVGWIILAAAVLLAPAAAQAGGFCRWLGCGFGPGYNAPYCCPPRPCFFRAACPYGVGYNDGYFAPGSYSGPVYHDDFYGGSFDSVSYGDPGISFSAPVARPGCNCGH